MTYQRFFHALLPALLGLFIVSIGLPAFAQTNQAGIAYKPPLRGAPSARVGGGTRGINTHTTLTVLAPDHVGNTIQSQPKLYWYISGPANMTLEVAINDPNAIEPIFEQTLKSPAKESVQSLALADYGVVLQPNIEYEWFVALVPDPNQRSNDVLSGGVIKRIDPEPALAAQLKQAPKDQAAQLFAANGLWYDSVEALSEQIDAQPGNSALRHQRATLLEQVGLGPAAAFDRGK